MVCYLATVYERLVIRDARANFASVSITEGEYDLEEVENPIGAPVPWLVLTGTRRGAAKSWWLDMERSQLLDLEEKTGAA